METGKRFDIHAAGMLALDVARVEAGLLLIEVDYTSSKKALIASQKYSPFELGFAKMVHLEQREFHWQGSSGKRSETRSRKTIRRTRNRLDGSRRTLRKIRSHARRAQPSLARRGSGLLRREASRQSYIDNAGRRC